MLNRCSPKAGNRPRTETHSSMAGPAHKPKWFRCLLGTQAREALLQSDASPDSFRLMLAASGGPKWLGLVGIDRCLKRFLSQRTPEHPLPLLGASSGSWRMAAMCCDQDGETYEQLIHEYIEQRFEGSPSPREVSEVCRRYIARLFTPARVKHALSNPNFQLNFTTALGPNEHPHQVSTLLRVLSSLVLNMFGRKHLARAYERATFSVLPHPTGSPLEGGWDDFPSHTVPLSEENFQRGLMASGSIPLVLEGESSIPHSPIGHHLDGGLIDYHFEVEQIGPILYPHFDEDPIPGWMDRFPPYRRISRQARDQLCLLLPSQQTLDRFPTGTYPCRQDFQGYPNDARIKLWRQTVEQSQALETELKLCLESGDLVNIAEPL